MISMVCRLCLSEESLEMVFKEEGLQQCISDYLSIQVSSEDHLSKAVCTICRIRLIEFHQYRQRCHEVQDILQSMFRNENVANDIPSKQVTTVDQVATAVTGSEPASIQIIQLIEAPKKIGGQQFQCEVCNAIFKISRQLAVHRRIHDSLNDGKIVSKADHMKKATQANTVAILEHNGSSEKGSLSVDANSQLVKLPVQLEAGQTNLASEQESRQEATSSLEEDEEITDYEDEQSDMSDESDDYENSSVSDGHLALGEGPHPNQNWRCAMCPKAFETRKQLKDHRYIHNPKNIECTVCKQRYVFKHQLLRHMERHRGPNEEKKYKCDKCDMAYKFEPSLSRHKKQMHGPRDQKCPICDARFALPNLLRRHMKKHAENHESREDFYSLERSESTKGVARFHGENGEDKESNSSFKCVKCPSSYKTRKDLLTHHRAKHVKKITCSLCSESFALSKQLQMHMQEIHKQGNNSSKALTCKECNKVFHVRRNLLRHVKIHEPLKHHRCTVCDKLFKTSEAVARHIKIHAKSPASDCKDDLGNVVQEHINQELQSKGWPANVEKDQGVSKKRSRKNTKLRQDADTSNDKLRTTKKDSTPKKKLTKPAKEQPLEPETTKVQDSEEEPVLVIEVEEFKLEPE